jgi:hypothetical protein
MAVPEAAMHKNCLALCGKDHVWLARQVFAVQSESVSHPMRQTSQG